MTFTVAAADKSELAVSLACLILHDDKAPITSENIDKLVKAAKVEDVEPYWSKLFGECTAWMLLFACALRYVVSRSLCFVPVLFVLARQGSAHAGVRSPLLYFQTTRITLHTASSFDKICVLSGSQTAFVGEHNYHNKANITNTVLSHLASRILRVLTHPFASLSLPAKLLEGQGCGDLLKAGGGGGSGGAAAAGGASGDAPAAAAAEEEEEEAEESDEDMGFSLFD